jgi:hypothetical protein
VADEAAEPPPKAGSITLPAFFLGRTKKGEGLSHHLFKAVSQGDAQKVQALLAAGADMGWTHKGTGRTALSEASIGGHLAIAQALLDAGADLEWRDRTLGYTPLAWASHGGHTELVALLIGKGAELNAASRPYAFTPLMNAAQNGHTAVVRALLEAGAEVHRETSDARNALSMAQRARKSDVVLLLEAAGSHLPAPLPVVPVIPWSDGGPAAVLRDFIRAMNRWEIDSLATIEADPQAGGDVILAAQQDVFALYCTDRKRPYGRQGSFGSPPTYDPAEVLIGQAEPRKLRAELTTRHGEREYFYVALCKKGLWRLDSKRQRHIGGDWFDDVL